VFFVLQGFLDVFVEDERASADHAARPLGCSSCPAGVIHGYQNDSLGRSIFQVMLGRGKPEAMAMRTTTSTRIETASQAV